MVVCPVGRLNINTCFQLVTSALKRSYRVTRWWPGVAIPAGVVLPAGLVFVCKSKEYVHCRRSPVQPLVDYKADIYTVKKRDGFHFDWSKLWEFLSPDLLLLATATASAVITALLNIAIPLELGQLVSVVSQLQPHLQLSAYIAELSPSGLKLVFLYATQGLFTFLYISILAVVGERLAVRLRTQLFKSVIEQEVEFFDRHKTGELVNRLATDVQELKSSFKMVISQGLRSVTQIVGCVTSLLFISPQMTGVVFIVVPSMVAIGTVMGSILRKWSREAQERVAMATSVADETISNVRTVRAFAMEEEELRHYKVQLERAKRANEKLGIGIAVFQSLSNMAINGLVLAVISHGGLLLSLDYIASGDLMAFLVATQTIQKSLGTLSVLFGQVVRGMSAGSRVFEYFQPQGGAGLKAGVKVAAVRGDVQFSGVSFAYPTRPEQMVLSEFSIRLPAGKVTALCGLSGAGKSTVAALMERFYEPTSGHITLDDHPLQNLDPSWLRGEVIGYISQEPVLFATSIMENIRYGKPSASQEEVEKAAKLANAHSFIESFPDGYSTVVGERGVTLSGGQKQRVAIARALIKDPSLLILDEATSALDAHSEMLVQDALERACKGRTVLIIAHRLSTIQGADQIAVLHKGKLKEVGSHSQLVRKNGVYSELIRRQTLLA